MIWKAIPGFEDYEISDSGVVRRCAAGHSNACIIGKVMRARRRSGYMAVTLYRDAKPRHFPLHILLLMAFVGPRPSPDHWGLHSDDNRDNNALSNLRWAPKRENSADQVRNGKQAWGEAAGHKRCTADMVREIRALAQAGVSQDRIGEKFGVTQTHVSRIVRREAWARLP